MTGITENILEQICLEWLAELGWTVLYGPDRAFSGCVELINDFIDMEPLP